MKSMGKIVTTARLRGYLIAPVRRSLGYIRNLLVISAALTIGLPLAKAQPRLVAHPEYLIQNWSSAEGIPENSALNITQTPDGYLWVGSGGGLLRFNGHEFQRVSRIANLKQLDTIIQALEVDRSGRLWASTTTGLAVLEGGRWRLLTEENIPARSVGQSPNGQVFIGTLEGRVYEIKNDQPVLSTNVPALADSGVFFIQDAKTKALWMANRTFVGVWTASGWKPVGPQPNSPAPLVAGRARSGGIWVYYEGQLRLYRSARSVHSWTAPVIQQPRELMEDSEGNIWAASMVTGLVHWRPGGPASYINSTNGLTHNAVRMIFQDQEDNIWAGTSSSGLFRLKKRYFFNIGAKEGLNDRIIKTIVEESPGRVFLGTHGGGIAWIDNDHVSWDSKFQEERRHAYTWAALRDRKGRFWIGTYSQGLFVQENGKERHVRAPGLGTSVGVVYEDSLGRIWVGTSMGLGLIENDTVIRWSEDAVFKSANVRSIVEDPQEGVLWVGTYGHGLWKVDPKKREAAAHVEGLPRKRITSLTIDEGGCKWVGVFGEGLFYIRDERVVKVGQKQGLPANIIGSMLDDGRGFFWLGSDLGILRVNAESLHHVVDGKASEAVFQVFDRTDGMEIQECSEGLQPTALRDSAGRLWFATLRGVVRVAPASLKTNERQPPVVVESFSFRDRFGTNHTIFNPAQKIVVPPGSTELEVRYAGLSYTAPEKVNYIYHLRGAAGQEVQAGTRRIATFQVLPPGHYSLEVSAANNAGVWSAKPASIGFVIEPFYWQTLWFRTLALGGLGCAVGIGGWRLARARFRNQIERLEQQRALEQERARLAAVMEATSDLVVFADASGNVLHLNPAGIRLLQLPAKPGALKLTDLFSPAAVEMLQREGIPAAERDGVWSGESSLLRRDGREIRVSQVLMAHRDSSGRVNFLSTIARDISEQRQAAEEHEKLQAQLAQAQKMESVGRLAGGVAHDFNNMLQVILGNVELALQTTPPESPLHQDLLEVRRSAERSASLTRQLLAFARKQPVSPRVLDLNETISGILKMLQRLIGESVQVAWVPGLDLWPVRMDPAQVDQILANLAVNARDAMPTGGRLIVQTANVVLSADDAGLPEECPPGDYIRLTVTDTGRGMEPEVLEHLFEPFFTTKALGQGTGLGLATVFGIVKQNRGAITVQSKLHEGSTFQIYFPRTVAPADTTPSRSAPLAGGTETLLLVEDEQQILELGRRALQNRGYTVLAASAPETALELASNHEGRVDLLITDIVMPGMNGKELRERLEQMRPGIKCLYMSGYTADIIASYGVAGPKENFIQKPFGIQDLLNKVRAVLQR